MLFTAIGDVDRPILTMTVCNLKISACLSYNLIDLFLAYPFPELYENLRQNVQFLKIQ